MATKKKIRHISRGRKLTSEEAVEYLQTRAQVEAEKPAINARIRQQLARAGALAELKRAREAMGLSLSDMQARTGIDRSTISKLETGRRTNYTLETALRYADALGKQVLVTLADKP